MLDDAARQWRRDENSQPARNSRQHVACALHHGFRRLGCFELTANPQPVFGAGGRLRRHLLDKKSVRRSRRHPASRSMRLKEKTAILEVGHHVAHRRGAQRVDVPPRHAARRDRLARLDVLAHHVRQNLLMTPVL